jgi:hypothetical protein
MTMAHTQIPSAAPVAASPAVAAPAAAFHLIQFLPTFLLRTYPLTSQRYAHLPRGI